MGRSWSTVHFQTMTIVLQASALTPKPANTTALESAKGPATFSHSTGLCTAWIRKKISGKSARELRGTLELLCRSRMPKRVPWREDIEYITDWWIESYYYQYSMDFLYQLFHEERKIPWKCFLENTQRHQNIIQTKYNSLDVAAVAYKNLESGKTVAVEYISLREIPISKGITKKNKARSRQSEGLFMAGVSPENDPEGFTVSESPH